jgi:phosphocarrier protein
MMACSGMVAPWTAGFWVASRASSQMLSPLSQRIMEKTETAPAVAGQKLIKELVVQNKMGIHARPAAMIVRITNKFKADVFVEKDDEQVNGKSIMGLMMLAAGKGSKVKFVVAGDDAGALLAELEALFARKFDEA